MFEFHKKLNCSGLRYPKVFHFKNDIYLIGSKKYKQENDITKYGIFLLEIDNDFNIINEGKFLEFDDYKYLDDITKSGWVRDINIKEDKVYLNVEIKQNVSNKSFFHTNYLLSTYDFIKFDVLKEYSINDFLYKELQFNNHNYIFTAKIEEDPEDINFNWGKYLFLIIKDDNIVQPLFDNIVDYQLDKGHVMGNLVYNKNHNEHTMYFSIRHKVDKSIHSSGFIYKIYTAKTKDLIHYYETQEVNFINKDLKSKWFSYPHYFSHQDDEYIVCNQDDFGKNLEPVIFKKKVMLEEFVAKQYNLQTPHNLQFTTHQNYIYYNELINQSGTRYDYIKTNNLNIKNFTTYAPSCKYLINVLKKLNISSDDSIIDIGSGWGYALSIFNLFPFKNITGIEICKEDVEICKKNLNILNLKQTNIINDSILNFNDYKSYNYFYLYNPFSENIFKTVVQNIPEKSIVIYKNIHDNEKKILLDNKFELSFEIAGEERNYLVFRKN